MGYNETPTKGTKVDTHNLEYLIKVIDKTMTKKNADFQALYADKSTLGTDANWLKARFAEHSGELGGTLLFIKDQLHKEIEMRKTKKFYQFWKK
jgi:hypothetical protein